MPYAGINTHTNALLTLDGLVASMQYRLGDFVTHDVMRIKQFIIEGYSDLHSNHIPVVKVKYMTVPSSNVLAMPDDMTDYVSIGVMVNGKAIELGRNKNMAPVRVNSTGSAVVNEANVGLQDTDPSSPKYMDISGMYGLGGGAADAYYKLDWTNRLIIFIKSVPNDEIILQYRSNGISIDSDVYIPSKYREVLIAWVGWKLVEYSRTSTRGERQDKEQRYWNELEKVKAIEGSFTEQELRDVLAFSRRQIH